MGGWIARRKRFLERFIDAVVQRLEPNPAHSESRKLGEGSAANAAREQRDTTERERGAEDATHRHGEADERGAPDESESSSRSCRRCLPTTDCEDVQRLP